MKHLSQTARLQSSLPRNGETWTIASFFFDFRLANEVGNSYEGLMRSLIHQLGQASSSDKFLEKLVERTLAERVDGDKSLDECLWKVLEGAATGNRNFLLLIDGIDEFSGNLQRLLAFLISLRRMQHLKICLASRPEAIIRYMLGPFPTINMSEHNAEGISQYLIDVTGRFQPLLDSLHLEEIQQTILDRAEGVFIWVYLVVEELLQACVGGATASEVLELLDMLPTELVDMYKRIVDRIPKQRRAEAVLMYTLVSAATFQVTLELLHSAMHLLNSSLGLSNAMNDIEDIEHFARRVYSTMGGLLEISYVREELYNDFEDFERTTLRARLIHETVRAFSVDSQWCEKLLPTAIPSSFVPFDSAVWDRLCAKAVLIGNVKTVKVVSTMLDQVYGKHISFSCFDAILRSSSDDKSLISLIPLIHQGIRTIPAISAKSRLLPDNDSLRSEVRGLMRCRLATMHFALVAPHFGDGLRFTASSLKHGVSDLILAASHHDFEYLQDNVKRIVELRDYQRDDIAMACLFAARRWGSRCTDESTTFGEHDPQFLHSIIDMIFCYNFNFSEFHLAVFLVLGYNEAPLFVQKMRQQYGSAHRDWQPVSLPAWNVEKNDIGPLFPQEHPLCIWLCEYDTFPQGNAKYEAQLRVLLDLGMHINAPVKDGGNILHYLIRWHSAVHRTHVRGRWGCYYSPQQDDQLIQKLYILEKHSVDFTTLGPYGSPLATLERCRKSQKQSKKTSIFNVLEPLLRFQQTHGHLPLTSETDFTSDDFPPGQSNVAPPPRPSRPMGDSLPSVAPPQLLPRRQPSRIPRPRRSPGVNRNRSHSPGELKTDEEQLEH